MFNVNNRNKQNYVIDMFHTFLGVLIVDSEHVFVCFVGGEWNTDKE